MNKSNVELHVFGYFLVKLIRLYQEKFGNVSADEIIGNLKKSQLMTFLYCTCLSSIKMSDGNVSDIGLFKLFDRFSACPFGPCYSPIWYAFDIIPGFYYNKNKDKLVYRNEEEINKCECIPYIDMIDEAIKKLEILPDELLNNNNKLRLFSMRFINWYNAFLYTTDSMMSINPVYLKTDYNLLHKTI